MSDVLVEHQGAVAVITLNRPERLNAITPEMGRGYAEALRTCGTDRAVRAIVVAGAGRGFCAGADLGVLAQGPDVLEAFLEEQRRDSPTLALGLPVPVVTLAAYDGRGAPPGYSCGASGSSVRHTLLMQ